ncbi:DUF924 family protein [Pleionea sp. CnH1-48]|uniref:DUF924 family protein n=1 Tax=Pleionea sp. CnH1-48 TaxID=2954494 RepID=UPI002098616C|nr:DUF924 family protein [Pleionea sp. CnH1-48]MCO7227430.1 DUF924 domain-containing protein [Pleionea sp. CnH1-48]
MTFDSNEIISFWFEELEPKQHWIKDVAFDQMIAERFGNVHRAASQSELFYWRDTALGRLAEIIVLDQFSRNMYRDRPESFAFDSLALCLSQEAVRAGVAKDLNDQQRSFLYMPYMHSESPAIHEEAVKLFSEKGLEGNLDFEMKHKVIIDRFGRYPHRNKILGRESTAEEQEFLTQPGSSF